MPAAPINTAMHHQIVDQEAQGYLLEVIGQQLFGEPAGEPHQMVGRNRAGHRNRHVAPFSKVTRSSAPARVR
jgi:hypothetical protein